MRRKSPSPPSHPICYVRPVSEKETIKNWLRTTGRSRDWLASECSVEKRTVDNWLSSPRKVPEKALRLITNLIRSDGEASGGGNAKRQNLVLELDEISFELFNLAALSRGLTIKEWAIDTLKQASRRYPVDPAFGLPLSRVAEGEPKKK